MFKRRNTREYKRQRGSVLYFTTMFAYADSEEKLKTMSESIGEIASEYNQEQFIGDTIAPLESNPDECNSQGGFYYHKSPQPSLVGREVIIDKDGVKENYTYRVRTENGGVQEFTRSNVIGSYEEAMDVKPIKDSEKELIKEYAIFGSMEETIDLLNMRGFEKFQILTGKGGYLNDGNLSDRDQLSNKVKVSDRILGMDFMVVVLG